MSQGEILEILKKSKKPLSAPELNKIMGKVSAGESLRKLVKYNEIKRIYKTKEYGNVAHYFL